MIGRMLGATNSESMTGRMQARIVKKLIEAIGS
jgi:hypothetical protein